MFILDTNVVSELRKSSNRKIDKGVLTWSQSVAVSTLYISAVTIMELEVGVLLVERRDIKQGARLRDWLDSNVTPTFAGRILAVDEIVARRCAHLHVPNRCAERDALIAATALTHSMTVVTRNVDDFKSTGVALLNPWRGA
jgi:toxin FitB